MTCIREIIPLIRMAEEYYLNKRDSKERGQEPCLLFLFDTGYFTVVSGWGELYEKYCHSKQLGQYTGRNVHPRSPDDPDYGHSRLRIFPFDHAFTFIRRNITDGMFWDYNCILIF